MTDKQTLAEKLYVAVVDGDMPAISELLDRQRATPDEKTLVHVVEEHQTHLVRRLIEAGAPVTPEHLHTAVLLGGWDTAAALVKQGVKADQQTVDFIRANGMGRNWEHLVTRNNATTEETTPAAARSARDEFNTRNAQDQLHQAAIGLDATKYRALLAKGIVPQQRTLAQVVEKCWTSRAVKLIEAGATPTPEMLHVAMTKHDHKTLEMLIQHGVVPSEQSLAWAANSNNAYLTEKLIAAKAVPTPEMLHKAVEKGSVRIAGVLIKGGAVPAPDTQELAMNNGTAEMRDTLCSNIPPPPKKKPQRFTL